MKLNEINNIMNEATLLKQARQFKNRIKALESDQNFANICHKAKFQNQNLKNKKIGKLKACLVSQATKYDNEAFINVVFLNKKEIEKKLIFAVEKPNYQIFSVIKFIEIL